MLQRDTIASLFLVLLIGMVGFPRTLGAQPLVPEANPVFDDTRIASVYIEIDPAALRRILGQPNSDVEELARFVYRDGTSDVVIDSIGFRLRGNTSRAAEKKSFKVSFNTFVQGQQFHGLEKLNLNGEHNDPSIIRSKLSWDLFAQMGVPSSRASHVKLYINNAYYGLYINVEHVDEQFLQSRFGTRGGCLYKCLWPADLKYLGPGPEPYRPRTAERRPYDLKLRDRDEEGYWDLAAFIDVINNTPDADFEEALEDIFEVNAFLKWMAVNVIVGMWDDYWFNQNNFYLYSNSATGRFVWIPFDYDNTFGIDWFGIDWAQRNVYTFGYPPLTGDTRPLVDRILNVPAYRDRYTFYLRQVLDGPFAVGPLQERVEQLHTQITPAAEQDSYRTRDYGWGSAEFHASFTTAVGAHVKYGLTDYIATRATAADAQLDLLNVPPILSYLGHRFEGGTTIFTMLVEDEAVPESVLLYYQLPGSSEEVLPMFDDGLHEDRAAGDGIYGVVLDTAPEVFSYRSAVWDALGQVSETRVQSVGPGAAGPLYINELMASNINTFADEQGEFDDWVELYNAGGAPISLLGKTMSDDPNEPGKWALPDISIAPGEYLLLWTDGDPEQGDRHGPFRLDKEGEEIGLYEADGGAFVTLDRVVFDVQQADTSYGRSPDGGDLLGFLAQPTPGAPNAALLTSREPSEQPLSPAEVEAFPNPFVGVVQLHLTVRAAGTVQVEVYDVLGRRVARVMNRFLGPGEHRITWQGHSDGGVDLPPGPYFLRAMIQQENDAPRTLATVPVIRTR